MNTRCRPRVRSVVTALIAVALIVTPGCAEQRSASGAQPLVDVYAPGIRLGESIPDSSRERYRLRVAPYLGYRDSGYAGPDGVRDLSIGVDEYIDDGDPKVSRGARVTEVILVLPTAATIAAVTARVRSALGAPDEACHPAFSYPRSPAPEFVRRLSWRGDRFGVVIGMAFGNPDRLAQRPAGWFAIGETPSVRGMGLATMPCPTRAAETP